MATVSIFANFRINDSERFQRMKDSFFSFSDVTANEWVVNARGKYKLDALFFLHEQLGDKLKPFVMESKKGWFHDSRKMLSSLTGDYVLFWIEDHICQKKPGNINEIVEEMEYSGAAYLHYTFFDSSAIKLYSTLPMESGKRINTFVLDKPGHKTILKKKRHAMIIGAPSVSSYALFTRIIKANHPFFKRWPLQTPFDFEKGWRDTCWLPLHCALLREELFASIDTDQPGPGGAKCLQSRGQYPARMVRQQTNPAITSPVLCKLKSMIPIWIAHRINRFRKNKYNR